VPTRPRQGDRLTLDEINMRYYPTWDPTHFQAKSQAKMIEEDADPALQDPSLRQRRGTLARGYEVLASHHSNQTNPKLHIKAHLGASLLKRTGMKAPGVVGSR
jgi:hypothetical protein